MPEHDGDTQYKARLFLWFGASCLLVSALLVPIRSSRIPLFSHQVPGLLICHTMLALGLIWVAAGNIILQTDRQRWLPVPFLIAYAVKLGIDWMQLLK